MDREQAARLDVAFDSTVRSFGSDGVADATTRFAGRGCTWKPGRAMQARLDALELGRITSRQVQVMSMVYEQELAEADP